MIPLNLLTSHFSDSADQSQLPNLIILHSQISDEASIMAMIDVVLAANPKQLAEFKGGKVNLKSFFEGWVLWFAANIGPGCILCETDIWIRDCQCVDCRNCPHLASFEMIKKVKCVQPMSTNKCQRVKFAVLQIVSDDVMVSPKANIKNCTPSAGLTASIRALRMDRPVVIRRALTQNHHKMEIKARSGRCCFPLES